MSRNTSLKVSIKAVFAMFALILQTNANLSAAGPVITTLTVNSNETEIVVGTNSAGYATVNTVSTGVLAKNVKTIKVTAMNPDGVIVDLSVTTRKSFPKLSSTEILTGNGDDDIYGSFVADKISTSGGDDIIYCSPGNDSVDGGAGIDHYDIISSDGGRTTITNTTVMDGTCRHISIRSIEGVSLDASNANRALNLDARNFSGICEVVGSRLNDNIKTGPGNDFVVGLGGSDYISTGDGDDLIVDDSLFPETSLAGGFGKDSIYAGNGNDQVYIHGGLNNFVDAGAGNDYVDASAGLVATSVIIDDHEGDDIYNCSSGDDKVYGFDGADQVFGNSGKDLIDYSETDGPLFADGGDGDDTILGSDGDDIIYGGAGINHLEGGPGIDLVDGVIE